MFSNLLSGIVLLLAFAALTACDSLGSATPTAEQSEKQSQESGSAPDSPELIRSEVRDEEVMSDDTGNYPPSYEVGIATAAAVREQRVTSCEDKPASERAACRAEANAEWEARRGEIEPSRSSAE